VPGETGEGGGPEAPFPLLKTLFLPLDLLLLGTGVCAMVGDGAPFLERAQGAGVNESDLADCVTLLLLTLTLLKFEAELLSATEGLWHEVGVLLVVLILDIARVLGPRSIEEAKGAEIPFVPTMDDIPADKRHLMVFTFLGKLLIETKNVVPGCDRGKIHETIKVPKHILTDRSA
jgi:hypothetical protein